MIGRQAIRGERRPVVVDLLLMVAIASLIFTGLRETIGGDLKGVQLLAAMLALFGIPTLAVLYGISAAIEMRKGWLGSTVVTGLLHLALMLGSVVGIALLAILCPTAAGMALASVSMLLLWSSSWL